MAKPSAKDIIKASRQIDARRRLPSGATLCEAMRAGSETYGTAVAALNEWIKSRDVTQMTQHDAEFLVVTAAQLAQSINALGVIEDDRTALPGDDAKPIEAQELSPIAYAAAAFESRGKTKQ